MFYCASVLIKPQPPPLTGPPGPSKLLMLQPDNKLDESNINKAARVFLIFILRIFFGLDDEDILSV